MDSVFMRPAEGHVGETQVLRSSFCSPASTTAPLHCSSAHSSLLHAGTGVSTEVLVCVLVRHFSIQPLHSAVQPLLAFATSVAEVGLREGTIFFESDT